MSVELQILVCAVALTLIQMLVAVAGSFSQSSLPVLVGNRDGMAEYPGWAGRAHRAHRNMLESLVLFAALVLVAHAAGRENAMTALGAQLFIWGRAAYAVIYVVGLPWVRTAAWAVALAGVVLILAQLF
ncbi:MAG: hypothetical protein GC203_15200 [Phenylobacterium sp.]|uniref:MAPEG family protein n=1 Tax=Phenylobacterium sp. TaxID=1871053 RepID=UPI0025D3D3B5|nr:MAPEG family protein [Phenylobacterium sp.]MBI1199205.1 hypothetical protein [Phenylobacterium sp.]